MRKLLFILLATFASTAAFAGELEDAVNSGDVNAAKTALEGGANPDSKTEADVPLLVLAAARNSTDIATVLLAAGADANAVVASSNASALMYASGGNNAELAKILLAAGADVDMRDTQGDPAVNWGAYYGSLAYIEVLLHARADTTLRGHGNAYEIAVRRGHEETVQVLAAYAGKDVAEPADNYDEIGRPLLHLAASAGDVALIQSMLDDGIDVDVEDEIGFTALMHASRDGQMAAVDLLLDNGADAKHAGSEYGLALTALHLAAISNQTAIVTRLIDAGAVLDVQGVTGQTPLAWGMFEGSKDAAIVLLDAGADWRVGPEDGPDLLELASAMGWDDVAAAMASTSGP